MLCYSIILPENSNSAVSVSFPCIPRLAGKCIIIALPNLKNVLLIPLIRSRHFSLAQDYYALPSPEQLQRPPDECPSGTEVPQIECHLAGIAVGQQAGWKTLNWKVLHQPSTSTTHPCGCSIWGKDRIDFNSNSSCKHHKNARLVCKVWT